MRLKGWIWLLAILLVINASIGLFGRQYRFDSILVHHSGGATGDLKMIRAMHQKRGWSDAAYHLVISNGSTNVPEGYLEATRHFASLGYSGATKNEDANLRDLQVCLVGNYDTDEVPQSLRPALAHALLALCKEFSIESAKILFHRDVGNTACPGKHITKDQVMSWMRELADQCPEDVKAQQLAVIATSSLSFSNYPQGLLVVQLCVSFLFTAIWFSLVFAFKPKGRRSRRAQRPSVSRTSRGKVRKNRHK